MVQKLSCGQNVFVYLTDFNFPKIKDILQSLILPKRIARQFYILR